VTSKKAGLSLAQIKEAMESIGVGKEALSNWSGGSESEQLGSSSGNGLTVP
jgi:hypothetical protein